MLTGTAGSREGEIESTFLWDSSKVVEEHVEQDIPSWPFLENKIFHRSLPVRASRDVLLSEQTIQSEKGIQFYFYKTVNGNLHMCVYWWLYEQKEGYVKINSR